MLWLTGGVLATGVIVALGLQAGAGHLRRYPAEVVALDRYADYRDSAEFTASNRRDSCFLMRTTPGGFAAYDKDLCLGGTARDGPGLASRDDPTPRVLMIGDSLSAHLWAALAKSRPDLQVLQATAAGCPPLVTATLYPACDALMHYVLTDWIPQNPPETVVLSAQWRGTQAADLRATIAALKADGVGQVVVLGPTVEYQAALPKLLARDLLNGSDTAAGLNDPERWQLDRAMAAMVTGAGAKYVDMLAVICPDGTCQTRVDGTPKEFDERHYTVEGAAFVASRIAREF